MKFVNTCLVAVTVGLLIASANAADVPRNVGDACGGIAGLQCGTGLYCNFGDGTKTKMSSCGKGDTGGKCAKIPQECPKNIAYVCGCDGKTYANACEAHRQGATSARPGRCDVKP
jgi:hypothetical protein